MLIVLIHIPTEELYLNTHSVCIIPTLTNLIKTTLPEIMSRVKRGDSNICVICLFGVDMSWICVLRAIPISFNHI